ncbi:MAG: hypothetical protein V1926_01695 [Candidatus Peregrinibacteria bacterium]
MATLDELAKVQELYLLQMELWKVLDATPSDRSEIRRARETIDTFTKLLKNVSWRYMGGEDVYASMKTMADEADQKLKSLKSHSVRTPVRVLAKRSAAKTKRRN